MRVITDTRFFRVVPGRGNWKVRRGQVPRSMGGTMPPSWARIFYLFAQVYQKPRPFVLSRAGIYTDAIRQQYRRPLRQSPNLITCWLSAQKTRWPRNRICRHFVFVFRASFNFRWYPNASEARVYMCLVFLFVAAGITVCTHFLVDISSATIWIRMIFFRARNSMPAWVRSGALFPMTRRVCIRFLAKRVLILSMYTGRNRFWSGIFF